MSHGKITSYETIIIIIRKIFDNYDEKNGMTYKENIKIKLISRGELIK